MSTFEILEITTRLNTQCISDRIGRLKLITIISGILTLGFIGYSYISSDGRDNAYLSCVIICFIISSVWTIAMVLGVIPQSELWKKIDTIFHIVATIFYITTLICFVVSVNEYNFGIQYRLWQRVIALILGGITATMYGLIACLMLNSPVGDVQQMPT